MKLVDYYNGVLHLFLSRDWTICRLRNNRPHRRVTLILHSKIFYLKNLLLQKCFCKKKKKLYLKTTLTTSAIVLLTKTSRFVMPTKSLFKICFNNLNPYTKIYLVFKQFFAILSNHHIFKLLQYFQIIIIFLNDYNNFKSSQYFSIIIILFNYYNIF